MPGATDNLRIDRSQPLISPAILSEELPLTDEMAANISDYRRQIAAILRGDDQRLLVIVGPCSVHDPIALIDYANRLKKGMAGLDKQLFPVLRVYFEKPRTVAGWKGLVNDPDMDETFHINKGLHIARQALLNVTALGLPAASEFLDTTFGQFYADLVSFGAIGARTVESQVHRELASGLSMPVGFKNGTNGSVTVAVDAIRSARHPHWFPSLTKQGSPALLRSTGNNECHLILRGGSDSGPNYNEKAIRNAQNELAKHQLGDSLIVDCSHANSGKDPYQQAQVCTALIEQIKAGNHGIRGVMIESHLVGGNQTIGAMDEMVYGQSVTDACLPLDDTLALLGRLAEGIDATA